MSKTQNSKHLDFLIRAFQQGKLAHSYLISGNDTIGKEQLIKEFLVFLLGPKKSELRVDVIEVNPEKNEISIGQIRRLKEQLSLSPWSSPCKIGIIRQAEYMNQEAQSAFLKLLEEPKGNTLLLLETYHSSLLLDTIRSRSQELRMYTFKQPNMQKTTLFLKLKNASLAERFAFAEKESQDPKSLYQALLNLQQEARFEFLKELCVKKTASTKILRVFQEVLGSLKQTQVNARFAAERILLEF